MDASHAPAVVAIGAIAAALLTGGGLALAGSDGGVGVLGVPAFALAGVAAFGLQWLAFFPAYLRQTEQFFDLSGSITYLGLVLFALWVGRDARSVLLAVLVGLWAVRLGSFLFLRVRTAGGDRRFARIKPDFWQFLLAWTLQGLWVYVTLAPALAAMTGGSCLPLGAVTWIGAAIWLTGFLIEVTADAQKRRFRSDPGNADRFITSGLWSWSRHPNYFGEILLWCGVALISLPVLEGWQRLTLISPVFVYVLLTRISGIRLLDHQAERRWGNDPDYQAYRRRTSRLLPLPPRGR